MKPNDYPLRVRIVFVASLLLSAVAIVIIVAGVTAIVAFLSERLDRLALGLTLLGIVAGSVVTYGLTKLLDRGRRRIEAKEVSDSLYNEIADRSARCLNDYIHPLSGFEKGERQAEDMRTSRLTKFRPVDPVVYPAVAGKLGLINTEALFPIIQFYFRLDAVRREIDYIVEDFDHDIDLAATDAARMQRVVGRFQETCGAALEALEKLNVESAHQIDAAASHAYGHLRRTELSLREALRKYRL
jgi:hypothetical protein